MKEKELKPKQLTPLQAAESIRRFCAYQERCHQDVRNKLFEYGLNGRETDDILAGLIEDGFLNEERFALQYAGGHMRQKKWGRIKIKEGLKARNISSYCIKKALDSLDPDNYWEILKKLAEQKWLLAKTTDENLRFWKTRQQLLLRGFENDLVNEVLNELKKSSKK